MNMALTNMAILYLGIAIVTAIIFGVSAYIVRSRNSHASHE